MGEDLSRLITAGRDVYIARYPGLSPYDPIWQGMRQLIEHRSPLTLDELWVVEHTPVYTQGQSGKAEHLIKASDIPLVQIDRGGQITYHGPGQLVVYTLLDLQRLGLTVKTLVYRLEEAIINTLATFAVASGRRSKAPGVYIGSDGSGAKIAALGLRIRRGCCYHGLSLNVDMDLSPFANINPCGYPGLAVTQLAEHCPSADLQTVEDTLMAMLCQQLGLKPLASGPL